MGAFEDLIAGNFFDSVVGPFTTSPANIGTEAFYLIIWVTFLGLIYMRTKKLSTLAVGAMVTSFALVPNILPIAQKYVWVLVIAVFVYIMYDIFKNRG